MKDKVLDWCNLKGPNIHGLAKSQENFGKWHIVKRRWVLGSVLGGDNWTTYISLIIFAWFLWSSFSIPTLIVLFYLTMGKGDEAVWTQAIASEIKSQDKALLLMLIVSGILPWWWSTNWCNDYSLISFTLNCSNEWRLCVIKKLND